MTEELLLVLEHLIQTTIQCVLFYQRKIFIQQISHRALLKPLPVQPPFASRINESIANQGLQNILPASSLPAVGQIPAPELIQPQLLVKMASQPTGSPLPGRRSSISLSRTCTPNPAAKLGSCRSAGNQCQGQSPLPFVIGSDDKTARLWLLQMKDLMNLARITVGRNFSADEWRLYFPGEKYRKTFEG